MSAILTKSFIRACDSVPETLRHGAVAIGNFDGVHRGHQSVLRVARERARLRGGPVVALTFEPHPRQFFRPDVPLFRLTTTETKARIFEALGLDGVVTLNFDTPLSQLNAAEFVKRWIAGGLAANSVVVGYDFHFAKGREGSPLKLTNLGLSHGFQTSVVGPQTDETSEAFSSTAIRAALTEGRLEDARRQLGYRWFFRGDIVHGEKRGRDLGYPTANMRLDPAVTLKHGVYAVRANIDGRILNGVASFGRRPQFDNGAPLFETFFFDFDGDLYGRSCEIELAAYLRPEAKFDSVDALIVQMDQDSLDARAALVALVSAPFGPEALAASGK